MRRRNGDGIAWARSAAAAALLACLSWGCGGQTSPEQALKQQVDDHPQGSIAKIAKFSGKITVDGVPPSTDQIFQIFLTADRDPKPNLPTYHTVPEADGHFEFTTFIKGDGVPIGKWIVTFAQLKPIGFHGKNGLEGPDQLHNLYNDPDKSQFHIELPPDKTDALYELTVAGKDPVATPGPRAVTGVKNQNDMGRGGAGLLSGGKDKNKR